MKFSVIIATHNQPEELERLLDSLAGQSIDDRDFEVIIVATAMDPAYELVQAKNWGLHIRIDSLTHDASKGRSQATKRNYGAQLASAPWLAFIDCQCIADTDWLANAARVIEQRKVCGVEGYTHIPEPEKKTLTYRGLSRLSRPGGFQACNMFYRKEDFLSVGGFDAKFPFLHEDTDLAWTFIDKIKPLTYCSEVRVEYPVPPAQPHRLLENALNLRQLPYLARKHPRMFANSTMHAYPRAYVVLLVLDIGCLFLLLTINWTPFIILWLTRLALTAAYMAKLFWGLKFTFKEVASTFAFTLICPLIGFFQIIRGNFENKQLLFFR